MTTLRVGVERLVGDQRIGLIVGRGGERPIAALSFVSRLSRSRWMLRCSEARWGSEAAKLALDQPSERDSRVVFKIPADDLHSDR